MPDLARFDPFRFIKRYMPRGLFWRSLLIIVTPVILLQGVVSYVFFERDLEQTTLDCLERYVPGIRDKLDHIEASTPRTFEHYTRHMQGASFGTKFEGLKISKQLPEQVAGLFHSGSVGIIMSGWLGAMNYGVIVANEVDKYLTPAVASV